MTQLMEFVEHIKTVSGVLVAIGAIVAFIKPLRKKVVEKVRQWAGYQENHERDNELADSVALLVTGMDAVNTRLDAICCQQKRTENFEKKRLRSNIVGIYRNYRHEKKLPFYLHKELVEDFETYTKQYGGNSYATEVFEKMREWDVVDE